MQKKNLIIGILLIILGTGLYIFFQSRKPKLDEERVGVIYKVKLSEKNGCENICSGKKRKLSCKRRDIEGNIFQWFFDDYAECTYLCLGDFSTSNGQNIPCEEQLPFIEAL